MSHLFSAENLDRDFLSKSLGGLNSSRGPPSLLHNGSMSHGNLASQVSLFALNIFYLFTHIYLFIVSSSFLILLTR